MNLMNPQLGGYTTRHESDAADLGDVDRGRLSTDHDPAGSDSDARRLLDCELPVHVRRDDPPAQNPLPDIRYTSKGCAGDRQKRRARDARYGRHGRAVRWENVRR